MTIFRQSKGLSGLVCLYMYDFITCRGLKLDRVIFGVHVGSISFDHIVDLYDQKNIFLWPKLFTQFFSDR